MTKNDADIFVSYSKVVVTTISGLAQIFTGFRLAYRWRTHRLWYDDAFAGFALAFSLTGLVAFWVRTDVPGMLNHAWHLPNAFPTLKLQSFLRSRTAQSAKGCSSEGILDCNHYVYHDPLVRLSLSKALLLRRITSRRAARMSLLFSTIRIIPSMMVMRRYAYYIGELYLSKIPVPNSQLPILS